MREPAIIAVAITGSVPRKADNPAVPISIAEQIESTHEAYEAGASLVHVHVRNEDGTTSSDPEKFAAFQSGIRRVCPDIIVQFSTGGRGRALDQRGAMLNLRPDMASLATGSCNFSTIVYQNPPDFVRGLAGQMRDLGVRPEIEVFDLAMLYNAADLVAEGLIAPKPHVQFVMGVRHIRLDRATLAPSNAALVRLAAELCALNNRPVATPAEARRILGLRPDAADAEAA
jgi:3-keto-5-aminohexanoate cleavage enzyme